MILPLPNLDDRRWSDLVEEGRNLIPRYAPEWTDFNVHDPGIMLLELFAWITEMDIFRLNRVPESHRRKFLALLGITLQPPQVAQSVVEFSLRNGNAWVGSPPMMNWVDLPATTEVETAETERLVRFRTLEAVTVVPAQLEALWREDQHGLHDLTEPWRNKEPLPIFGDIPKEGAALYFSFSEPLPEGRSVTLYLRFTGGKSGAEERKRLQEEWLAAGQDCAPSPNPCQTESSATLAPTPRNLPHHSARTVWEVGQLLSDKTSWRNLNAETEEVIDETRACTLDGFVRFALPAPMSPPSESPRYNYLRCRFVSGEYDAAPILQTAIVNAAPVEQAFPVGTMFTIARGAVISGPVPPAGSFARFVLRFNAPGEIARLTFLPAESNAPESFVTRLTLPTGSATGIFGCEMQLIERGLDEPSQEIPLQPAPVQSYSIEIFTLEGEVWKPWSRREDFDASSRSDRHFVLDATTGTVTFGDGENGLTVPRGALIFAKFRTTHAERGNVLEQRIRRLSRSAHNQALLETWIPEGPIIVSNAFAATGGAETETLAHAEGRVLEEVKRITRAVTIADIEYLARSTPGTNVARVAVKPNLDARYPCLQAPGTITVIILPQILAPGAQPSLGLRAAVRRYLNRRRILGSRIEVVGPTYSKVTVKARVQSQTGANPVRVQQDILKALQDFFDPLHGGPEKTGWPFGRDVYRSEVLHTIDSVAGVENLVSLELIANDGTPSCGNLCIGPCGLVISGEHEIIVE
jgi:Baseplate J-like protein